MGNIFFSLSFKLFCSEKLLTSGVFCRLQYIILRRADTSRHYASQEKVGSSNCVHTTTHAMFVGEPRGNGEARGKRAPLAEQESEVGCLQWVSWLPGLAWDCRFAGQDCCDRSLDWRTLKKCGNRSKRPHFGNLYSLQTSSDSEPALVCFYFPALLPTHFNANQHGAHQTPS